MSIVCPIRQIVLVLASIVLGVAAAACGSDDASRTPTSTVSVMATQAVSPPVAPTVAPTVEPTPAPLLKSTGRLVYLRGKDLYTGDLATGEEQRLTTDSLGAGYAGSAEIDGNLWLYYTTLSTISTEADGSQSGTFDVYRRQLGGAPEALFTFQGNSKNIEFSETNASVAPDGLHMAFSYADGLRVRDLSTGTETVLLTNGHCDAQRAGSADPCHGSYYAPQWSPRGDWLFVQKIVFEGANGVLIHDPLGVAKVVELKVGGLLSSWSPDGTQLCMADNGYQPSSVGRVDPNNPVFRDLYPSIPAATLPQPPPDHLSPGACAWSPTGGIVAAYTVGGQQPQRWLVQFDVNGGYLGRGDVTEANLNYGAVTWLPDASGFILGGFDPAEQRGITRALLFDGTFRRLPFDAERVLGTIALVPPKDD